MSERGDFRSQIAEALAGFEKHSLADAARGLFNVLGYRSDRTLPLKSVAEFVDAFDPNRRINPTERALLDRLVSLRLLFQLTDAELTSQSDLLSDSGSVENTRIHSYLFFAVELSAGTYTRTALSSIARAINKPLPMPALVLFRYGDALSLAIIHRRLSKREADKDVLEKVDAHQRHLASPIRSARISRSLTTSPSTIWTPTSAFPTSSRSMRRGKSASAPTRFRTISTARSPIGISGRIIR